MHSIAVKTHIGSDGKLKLDIPVDLRDVDVEIVVTMRPMSGGDGWPDGYFDRTAGALADSPIERGD